MFLAFGYQPGLGPLAVAYAAANIASAIPITLGRKRRHLSVYHRQILVGGDGFPIHWY